MFKFVVLCLFVLGGVSIDDGVVAHPVKNVFSSVDLSNESGGGAVGGFIPGYGAVDFVHASLDSLPDFAQGAFYTKSTTSATFQLAAKEYDPPLSQIIGVYDHTQNKAKDFLHAESVVDKIREEDKYGNTGDKHAGVGRFVVNGFEGISNIINKLFEFPRSGKRLIGKGVTEQLNKVGAKLVGLAKK